MNRIHQWLKYYRASLIDGNRGLKKKIFPTPLKRNNSVIHQIKANELEEIWNKDNVLQFDFNIDKAYNENDSRQSNSEGIESENRTEIHKLTKVNKIEIAPLSITSSVEHGDYTENTEVHYPFWIPAYVDDKGKLYPPQEGEVPIFIRNYLNPNAKDLPAIADMETLDKKLTNRSFEVKNWVSYWDNCERFFEDVTNKKFSNFQSKDNWLFSISKYAENNTTRNILKLYNNILFDEEAQNYQYPVLEKVLEKKEESENHTLSQTDVFLNENHYGQMGDKFPLSYSQRDTFSKFTSKYNDHVFAINGPPGTGKTTILQSVIANAVVQSVLNKDVAPLIVGCSANNQAITNILDSMQFGDFGDSLSQRWIPEVHSFGLYLASQRSPEKYQKETNNYLNSGFVKHLDNPTKAITYENYYKKQFKSFFKDTINDNDFDLSEWLYNKINDLKISIDQAHDISLRSFKALEVLKKYGYHDLNSLKNGIKEIETAISKNQTKQNHFTTIKQQLFEKKKQLPFYIKILPFKRFKQIKSNAFKLVTHSISNMFPVTFKWDKFYLVISKIDQLLLESIDKDNGLSERLKSYSDIEHSIRDYEMFKTTWLKKYSEKWNNLIKKTNSEYQNLDILQDTAVKLDVSYRYELFWLCIHYREWEYIQELKKLNSDDNERGKQTYQDKLRRIAKITPLFISTFHSLPKFCSYYNRSERFYNGLFDLMIVDESGQVSPEIAIPSLSFTKKVLAVGDIYQIEPVWNITKGIDFINAKKYQIVAHDDDYKQLDKLGFTASNGSLMKIIRKSTPFSFRHYNGEEEKGAYLLEHRRCLDPIIAFSKEHVYKGSLKLMVGDSHDKTHDLPPLGYIHINGYSQKHKGYSRKNIKEANTIVQWILLNKEKLENTYANGKNNIKPLYDILAVITPFSAQKTLIKHLLKAHLDKVVVEKLIVGTVHALQGAEKPVILFSAVHHNNKDGLFFDRQGKFNMLNVALTRAKHAFVLFGNMSVFNPDKNSPSGKLAKLLLSNKAFELDNSFIYESKIVYPESNGYQVKRINTLESHRACLKRVFEVAEVELIVFSPFISKHAINNDNIEELIKQCVQRHVKVRVITDKTYDFDEKTRNLKPNSQQGRTAIKQAGAHLFIENGIHNKTICVDDKILIEGSFNWLSADRTKRWYKKDASVIIQNGNVEDDIKKIKEDLEKK